MPDIDVILFLTKCLVFCIEEEKLEGKKSNRRDMLSVGELPTQCHEH